MPEDSTNLFTQLATGLPLLACLTCGAAVPPKAAEMHNTWHTNIANAAISTQRQVDQLTGKAAA